MIEVGEEEMHWLAPDLRTFLGGPAVDTYEPPPRKRGLRRMFGA